MHKEQLAEAAKAEEAEDEVEMDGFRSDDDDDESDREMADDDEDGDEADSLRLQKLAAKITELRDKLRVLSALMMTRMTHLMMIFVMMKSCNQPLMRRILLFSLLILSKDNIGAGWIDRQGMALALHSVADVLGTKDLPVVMTILISRTLGLIIGSAELREKAALGRGGLSEVTSEQALKEFFIPITGPLIRIIGDRFPWQVKSAILSTLSIIIQKGGLALKPFLPQLQTTFDKCLQDNTRTVRSSAALALGKLSALTTRIDPLVLVIFYLLYSIQMLEFVMLF